MAMKRGREYSYFSLLLIVLKHVFACQRPFSEEEVVILNAVDADLDLMTTRMEARQARLKLEKKLKKASIKQEIPAETETNPKSDEIEITATVKIEPTTKTSVGSKLINKIHKDGVQMKRPTDTKIENPEFKKAKSTYSVAKDPNATDVYKSLFTTSRKAQDQTKAHWITYNPFYN